MSDQIVKNSLGAFVDTKLVGVDLDLRIGRGLIRIVNTREVLNNSLTGLLVQTLRIALLSHLERDIDMNLDEWDAGLFVDLASVLAIGDIGGDKSGSSDDTNVTHKFGNLRDTTDVLLAISGAEAEVAVETETDVISIKTVDEIALLEHHLLKGDGHGGFAGA